MSISLLFTLAWAAGAAEAPVEIFVAPGGNDAAPGTLAQPLGSLARAQAMVREVKKKRGQAIPVRVVLRGGTYFIGAPLVFTAEDAGTAQQPVVWTAYGEEKVLISGGQEIKGWAPGRINGKDCWVAQLPTEARGQRYFRELFVFSKAPGNPEIRRPRPRLPRTDTFRFSNDILMTESEKPAGSLKFNKGDLKNWGNLGDIDLVMLDRWVDGHCRLKRVDEKAGIVYFDPRAARSSRDSRKLPARYFVENVKEALDTPGQWYLDRPTMKLYYIPLPGERMDQVLAIAPRLEELLHIEGGVGAPVGGLRFERICFAHAETRVRDNARQSAANLPAAVVLRNVAGCDFYCCSFVQIGEYAVDVQAGCRDNRFIACNFDNLGAGGIKVEKGSEHTTISDCTFMRGGRIWHCAVAVLIQDSPRNRVLHCDIHDFDSTGVSVGWTWGYGPTETYDNHVEYNHIDNLGNGMLDDLGGIYTLGTQAGTVLRGNVIHDVTKYVYGGWGIYTDEGSSGILIEGNLVYRTHDGGFHQHYGRDNLVRNNIFALAKEWELVRSRGEAIRSFTFENNIVYLAPEAKLFHGTWDDGNYTMRNNIFWREGGSVPDFNGMSLAQWQRLGRDVKSVGVDPLFVNAIATSFTLRADSPVPGLGFKPIDPKLAGRRPLDARKVAFKDWPLAEAPAGPILEGRLENEVAPDKKKGQWRRFGLPLRLKAEQPLAVTYTLWNRGEVEASGEVVFRMLAPESAQIEGDPVLGYQLRPGEKVVARLTIRLGAKNDGVPCRLVAIPRGEGLMPSALYFNTPSGGKK